MEKLVYWYSKSLDRAFDIKSDALLSAKDIEFKMGSKYDQYDWSKEPPESWNELIKERCIQLRDENKFLRLWYSGGEDSQTILNCFIKHKIPIDEIGLMRVSIENNFNCLGNSEINKVALPFLNENRDKLFGANVKLYDLGLSEYTEYMKNFSLLKSNMVEFRISYHTALPEIFPGINEIDGIKNIDGVDKPQINIDYNNYKFYWYGDDARLLSYVIDPKIKKDYEHFYIDNLKIHAKQVYLAVDDFFNKNYCTSVVRNSKLSCRDKLYKPLSLKKATQTTLPEKVYYAIQGCLRNPETRHIYKSYLRGLNETGLDKIYFNRKNPKFYYRSIMSKKYYLKC